VASKGTYIIIFLTFVPVLTTVLHQLSRSAVNRQTDEPNSFYV